MREKFWRNSVEEANSVTIPADNHQDLSMEDLQGQIVSKAVPYREAVGSILFLSVVSRPDIAYAVSIVSQYLESPKKPHWNAVKRILKYIKGTLSYGILFKSNIKNLNLEAFSDADFAGEQATARSTTGYLIRLGNSPITWGSKKQTCVSLSTTESEYISAGETTQVLLWISELIKELDLRREIPILYLDNQSAIKLIKNPEFHKRTRHINVKFHFIRQNYADNLKYVCSKDQLADILTKALCKPRFSQLRDVIISNGTCNTYDNTN